MTDNKLVAVAGATGAQGGALTRRLLQRGHQVHALVRAPKSEAAVALASAGAEVVPSDFDDGSSLVRAMSGVDAAYLMATPFVPGGTDSEIRHGTTLVDAAVRAGVDHVVYSSVASADRGTRVPHFGSKYVVERYLRRSGALWTVVAPTEFLDMVLAPWTLPGLAEGRIGVPVPGSIPRQLTAVDDLAAFACLVIEDPDRFAGRRVEIASDVVTGDELAAALTRAAGRTVGYVETPPSASYGRDLLAMFAFMRREGYRVDIDALHARYPEVGWHRVESWLSKQDWPALLGEGAA
ncbi:MAG: NmrA family NAD(P)-binding protein [Nocardioidaceae bacterium]